MTLRLHRRLAAWLLAAACSTAASTAAEDRIAEVIVSASRIGAVDQLAAVLEEEDLLAGFHGADALWTLPGLALSAAGNRGAITQARLRGAEANHLLVLFDGVAVNDPATGSEFNFGALDLTGVRRVELLAGPQSAVWGSDALAGVLHFDSTPKRSGRRLALGWGSHGTVDADAAFARVDGKSLRAVSVGRARSDGTNAALSGSEADGFANTAAHLRADTERGAWALSSVARWSEADTHYDPTPPPRFVPQDGDRRGENPRQAAAGERALCRFRAVRAVVDGLHAAHRLAPSRRWRRDQHLRWTPRQRHLGRQSPSRPATLQPNRRSANRALRPARRCDALR